MGYVLIKFSIFITIALGKSMNLRIGRDNTFISIDSQEK